jgi:hypothetical protein
MALLCGLDERLCQIERRLGRLGLLVEQNLFGSQALPILGKSLTGAWRAITRGVKALTTTLVPRE